MALRLALLGFPFAAVTALVILLNSIDAGAGIAVAALGLVAVSGGAALGYFADRLPDFPRARRHDHDGTRRLAGAHHGHR
jgi:hypothetical protein